MTDIGVNTYGLGPTIRTDFEGTFRTLKEAGFTAAEPMVVFPDAVGMPEKMMRERLAASGQDGTFWTAELAKERIAWLRREGFRVEGMHIGLARMARGGLNTLIPAVKAFAQEVGLSYVVHSPQKPTAAEISIDAEFLRKLIAELTPCGIEVLFHCHYHEFQDDNGDTPFDYLLREVPVLRIEPDVGWIHYAGRNPADVLRQYAGRIACVHFKDLSEDAGPDNLKNCFTAIGEGTLPLAEIMEAASHLKFSYTGFIIDQDNSRGDMLEDLRNGKTNILQYV